MVHLLPQVTASYEENLVCRPGHNGGDGTSTSSVGTASPDIFQGELTHLQSPVGVPVVKPADDQSLKMTEKHKSRSSAVK